MDSHNRRRNPPLVLYAPLTSTRRSSTSQTSDILPRSTSGLRLSVPFSWESSPGVPRPHIADDEDDEETPPPKPPPGRRENGKSMQVVNHETCSFDSGEEEEEDAFSDALEEIAMSDKFDVACSPSSFGTCDKPPSFIMDRFLLAADAVAETSVRDSDGGRRRGPDSSPLYQMRKEVIRERLNHRATEPLNDRHRNVPSSDFYGTGTDTPAELPSMACGLMLFFPCSFKPTVCGFKSPARTASMPRSDGNLCSTPKKLSTSYNGDHGYNSSNLKSLVRPRNHHCWRSDDEDDEGGGNKHYAEKLSVKLRHPHSRSRAREVEKWKGKARRMNITVHDTERKPSNSTKEAVAPTAAESMRGNKWRLPRLSWLY